MKPKYLIGAAVLGTVLLTTTANRDRPSELENSLPTEIVQSQTETSVPYSSDSNEPNKDPNDYDTISNMKAIIEPRDEIYDSKNKLAF